MSKEKKPSTQPSLFTALRYEQYAMSLAYDRMVKCPECQPEVIARHYAAHATLALNLLELCRARRYSRDTKDLDTAIEHCVEQIKNNHRHDFGIELEWPNDKPYGREPNQKG